MCFFYKMYEPSIIISKEIKHKTPQLKHTYVYIMYLTRQNQIETFLSVSPKNTLKSAIKLLCTTAILKNFSY